MLRSTLVILLLAFSASASAEGFSYNYLTLGYGNTDFDVVNADGDGITLGGSYAFSDKIHGFFGYDTAELESIIDLTRLRAGVGYNTGLTDAVDMYARISYESIDFDFPNIGIPLGIDTDDSGYGLGVGVRFRTSDVLELNAGIRYVDYSDLGDDTGLELGGVYSFNDTWSLGLHGEFSDDVSTYTVSGRFYFR
ncbi:MAG: porin family protein [Gammaproteobacteria bacterium]|nr:porin family protein [Gammaproteobacteria bacterium]MDH3751750.1 porin family protein [Gammaproteobacteria bacterium]MDH3804245.1 porin family protein [Gammaproteobacteria bacterium]